MHAYASDDPVFVAMNARGQRETDGALGDFCVKCHAPIALREGSTTDGLDLADAPRAQKGVTCFFCHSVAEVTDDHNNPLTLADDLTLRGGFGDAIENGAHRTGYSRLHDTNNPDSSTLCGSCHDIVTPAGVHLERTFAEYQASVFPGDFDLSCGDCHTPGERDAVVADFDGVPLRTRHRHDFPGVDSALTAWPAIDDQRAAIAGFLRTVIEAKVCHDPVGNQIDVRLTNIGAGHGFPSGAAQDRRAWVQIRAYSGDTLTYASGVVPEGAAPDPTGDPDLWELRDHTVDADGQPTHMFWDVADVESELLGPAVTLKPEDPAYDHSVLHHFPLGASPAPDRIELRVFVEAIGKDVLDDLIDSGDLAADVRDEVPRFTVAAPDDWTLAAAGTDRCLTLTEPAAPP
jgi:hypothetical protein